MQTFRPWLMTAASLISLTAAASVQAQEATTPAQDSQEIVVTTQKRSQSQFKVPVTVTAISANFMKDNGINDFAQLSRFVPGFEVQDQSPNNPGFVVRGITSDSGESVGETRVSVFQDGVSISRSRGSYVELFDLNRVEVAKGPQSTLFGRGALIGAVNINQNKADPKAFDAEGALSLGNLGYRQADLMLNVPLSQTFAVRFAGRSKYRDGYVDNLLGGHDFNSLDTTAERLAFNWQPSGAWNFDLIFNHQYDGNTGTSFKSGTFMPTNPTTGAVIGDTSHFTGAALATSAGFHDSRDLGLQRSIDGATLLASYHLNEKTTISSTTAWRQFKSSEVFDADGFSLPLLTAAEDARARQTSQELRVNYDNHDNFSWFAGLSYFEEHGSQTVPLQISEFDYLALTQHLINPASPPTEAQLKAGLGASPTLGAVVPFLKSNHREGYANYGDTESYDAFADATWRLTPKFELSLGLRYTHDDKVSGYMAQVSDVSALAGLSYAQACTPVYVQQVFTQTGTLLTPTQQVQALQGIFAGLVTPPAACGPRPVGLTVQPTAGRVDKPFDDSGTTYRIVGRYEFNPAVSTYLSVSRGRQPRTFSGGTPAAPNGAPTFTEAAAETVDSIEWGVKSRLLDGRLIWDNAVYNYEYKNFRTTVQTGPTTFEQRSAGEANSYGFETQANYRAAKGVTLFGTYAYSHARFGNGLYKGNSFRLNPDNKVSLGASFVADTASGLWNFTPSYNWQSKIFFDDNNDLAKFQTSTGDTIQDEVQKAYGLLNLRAGYAPHNSAWKLEVFVDNATDVKYIKDAGNTGDTLGFPTFIRGTPMTYGLTLRFRR